VTRVLVGGLAAVGAALVGWSAWTLLVVARGRAAGAAAAADRWARVDSTVTSV
jgi:hypothetical protein